MKFEITCPYCGNNQIYQPRKEVPKDPHTKCSKCKREFKFKVGDPAKTIVENKSKKVDKKKKSIPPKNTTTTFIDDPDELLLSVSMRMLNKPEPDPRWANVLITTRRENIGKSKKEGNIQSKFKSMSISEVSKILARKQENISLKKDLKESS